MLKSHKTLTKTDILDFTRKLFSRQERKIQIQVGHRFIVGLHKELGDEQFYKMLDGVTFIVRKKTIRYINRFIKRYELAKKVID